MSLLPKYFPKQKVFVDGVEREILYPVRMECMNAITGERSFAGWYYRFEGFPQDIPEEKVSTSPEELLKNMI